MERCLTICRYDLVQFGISWSSAHDMGMAHRRFLHYV